jgi:hypothetical protein
MATNANYGRLRKTLKIYLVIQIALVLLLIGMAYFFLGKFAEMGNYRPFMFGIGLAVVVQLLMFWPIRKFAAYESDREIESCRLDLTPERMKALRTKRMVGDVIRSAVIIFFLVFVGILPKGVAGIYWPVFLSFIFTFLSYFQCMSFALKRGIPPNS